MFTVDKENNRVVEYIGEEPTLLQYCLGYNGITGHYIHKMFNEAHSEYLQRLQSARSYPFLPEHAAYFNGLTGEIREGNISV